MATGHIHAPNFSLPDQTGKLHSLKQYEGQWVVIYMYPKDDTPACTKEACSFRDHFAELKSKNVVVLGISRDTIDSHQKFQKKYSLPFPLLSDPDHITLDAYGAWGPKKFMGKVFDGILRNSYLIDPTGVVRKTYQNVKPQEHVKEILRDVEALQG